MLGHILLGSVCYVGSASLFVWGFGHLGRREQAALGARVHSTATRDVN